MIVKSHRWQITAIAAAAFFGLWGSNAMALSLGRVVVQSALGEPLRAEIDVPDINAEEAASLKASLALPEAFRAAGLEYNPAIAGLQVTFHRRTDGRAYISLRSERAINDPFVDLIVEASWATGRIVRDYTLLFDPPNLRPAAAAAPTPAQIPGRSPIGRAAPSVPATPSGATAPPAETRTGTAPARTAVAAAARTPAGTVTVKSGDTAGKIAIAAKPASVSLDQMLVALLRTNPDAFLGDNVNRIKAGSIINIPTAEQAQATPALDATRIIVAQSKDFNDFRRKLAVSAPGAQLAAAERQASGSVQAKVDDKKPVTSAPDKLTLSKGALQGKQTEQQLAKERSAKEAASRTAELAKNISELSKLGAASSAGAPGLTASAAAPAKSGPALGAAAITSPRPSASAPELASAKPAPAASVAASAVASPATQTASAPKPVVAVAVPPPAPSLVDGLIENPLVPAGAIGLIALLAGFGLYRIRQRKNAAQADSSYLESRLQPDSFFGASGGQSVDTSDTAGTSSSVVYTPSQLDAVDDVDPVAEADVYMAYGRDLQAEEILKEALQADPGRIAIHLKLLEIFAKRRDSKAFEDLATQAFTVSGGDGPEWGRICELGLSIDPENTLYQPGGQPSSAAGAPSSSPAPLDFTSIRTEDAGPRAIQPPPASDSVDLDLDFSLDDEAVGIINEATASKTESAESAPSVIDMDFGSVTDDAQALETPQATPVNDALDLDFALPDLDVAVDDLTLPSADNEDIKLRAAPSSEAPAAPALASSAPPAPASPDFGMLEFDLGSLSLDLGSEPKPDAAAVASAPEDPLATKLALAQEFSAIGDDDGARALIEEVVAEATGDMKIKAQRALSNL